MQEKKYELTDETIEIDGQILHRIKSLKNFRRIKKGQLGGFINNEFNLSQDGNCWIFDLAMVYDKAMVYDNAEVFGNATIFDEARVYDNAKVSDEACIYGHSRIYDNAKVGGYADICGNVFVTGNSYIYGHAIVYGNAAIHDNTEIFGNAMVYGDTEVIGTAKIYGNVQVYGNVDICGDAEVKEMSDYMVFRNSWSNGLYFTWTKSNNMWTVGSFYGTGEELIEKAYKNSEKDGKNYEIYANIVKNIE